MKIKQKLSILSFSICLLLAGNLSAQEPNHDQNQMENGAKLTPEQRADKRSQLLKDKLKLDDQQTSQARAAILEFEQSRSAGHEEMRKNYETLEVTLNSIFTPEQQKQFEVMQEQRKAEMKARKEKGHPKDENSK